MPGLGRRVCGGDTPTCSIIAPSRKDIADRDREIGEHVLPFQRVAFAPPHHPGNRTMEDGTKGTGVSAAIMYLAAPQRGRRGRPGLDRPLMISSPAKCRSEEAACNRGFRLCLDSSPAAEECSPEWSWAGAECSP